MQRRRVLGSLKNGVSYTYEQSWSEKVTVTAVNFVQSWDEKKYCFQKEKDVFAIPYGGGYSLSIKHSFVYPSISAVDWAGNASLIGASNNTAGDIVTVTAVQGFNGYVILKK